jgi:hypothetical protein
MRSANFLPLTFIDCGTPPQEETDQPSQWLKQVLLGVASLNKTGENKQKYELKAEYRVS